MFPPEGMYLMLTPCATVVAKVPAYLDTQERAYSPLLTTLRTSTPGCCPTSLYFASVPWSHSTPTSMKRNILTSQNPDLAKS
ncbi:uncharacterized protein C8Q71DRAFT_313056 [Rhodofomes roseus]|uniref:Uncharacterized protein n=1 Tax=Rhodofomes roseus TaxID=34475 RepID=A0ABQ8K3M9_9APHY|nr:uncharacterized protein C8Q71DRAFT_313056 [Rhodofomes roseus]KAH9830895.1 hypothetical protein C8Q71DRAFT_313056 [Rhodofomes roseus]